MKKIFKKASVFMCGALVALSSISTSAFADTSCQGTLSVSYQTSSESKSHGRGGFRNAFSATSSSRSNESFAIISMKDKSSSSYTASYCIDHNKVCNARDTLTAGAYSDITNEEKVMVNYALLNGFCEDYSNPDDISTEDGNLYYATQCLVWVITEGAFYDEAERTKLEEYFGANSEAFKATYEDLYQKVYDSVALPEFAATDAKEADTINLQWNSGSNCFEAEVPNIGNLKGAKCDQLPDGVTVDTSGDTLKITSTKELKDETIKLTIESDVKGGVVCWENGGNKQPQATIDETKNVEDYDSFIKVDTEDKKEETPEAKQEDKKEETAKPEDKKEETPVVDEQVPEESKPEVNLDEKEETQPEAKSETSEQPKEETKPDDSNAPQTGDVAPVVIAGVFLGISAIVGTVLGVKKYRANRLI